MTEPIAIQGRFVGGPLSGRPTGPVNPVETEWLSGYDENGDIWQYQRGDLIHDEVGTYIMFINPEKVGNASDPETADGQVISLNCTRSDLMTIKRGLDVAVSVHSITSWPDENSEAAAEFARLSELVSNALRQLNG